MNRSGLNLLVARAAGARRRSVDEIFRRAALPDVDAEWLAELCEELSVIGEPMPRFVSRDPSRYDVTLGGLMSSRRALDTLAGGKR